MVTARNAGAESQSSEPAHNSLNPKVCSARNSPGFGIDAESLDKIGVGVLI
jgi:hypothetical protein